MKIYTRTGDAGDTGLFGGGRVPKDDPRVEAYGAVDELNSMLGVAAAALEKDGLTELVERLRLLQVDLFAIGAHLATPGPAEGGRAYGHLPELPSDRATEMEGWIDDADARLEPLRSFILPGGTESAAQLHLARTVCRRAERRAISLGRTTALDPGIIVYLNRLSDLLFTLARLANQERSRPDVPWTGRR